MHKIVFPIFQIDIRCTFLKISLPRLFVEHTTDSSKSGIVSLIKLTRV
jgi:hypothetical protein